MPPTQTDSAKFNNNNGNYYDKSAMLAMNNTLNLHNMERQNIIVFDWDDTLLASTFLSSKGLRLDTDRALLIDMEKSLQELEQGIITVLTTALQHGDVHIITNAETGWVELSAAKFIPGVVPLLNRVSIISARSTFEAQFPGSPLRWKYYAFQEKLAPHLSESKKYKNIISFGDSHVEREAVRAVTRGYANTRCKSIKFAERPTIDHLKRQLELVTNCFQYIFQHEGDLDLQLTITVHANMPSNNNAASPQTTTNNTLSPPVYEKKDSVPIAQLSKAQSILNDSEEKPSSW
jgi:hypothetical protein